LAWHVVAGRTDLLAAHPPTFGGAGRPGPRSGGTTRAQDPPVDFARRRPEGAPYGGIPIRRDGRAARFRACVMRRELGNVRLCVGPSGAFRAGPLRPPRPP